MIPPLSQRKVQFCDDCLVFRSRLFCGPRACCARRHIFRFQHTPTYKRKNSSSVCLQKGRVISWWSLFISCVANALDKCFSRRKAVIRPFRLVDRTVPNFAFGYQRGPTGRVVNERTKPFLQRLTIFIMTSKTQNQLDPLRDFLDAVVTRIEALEAHCGLSSGLKSPTSSGGAAIQKTPSVKHLSGAGMYHF